MQQVYNAIEACAQNGTDDPKRIALVLKQVSGPDDDPLNVFDPEEWRTDWRNCYHDQLAPTADFQLSDID
jgi:hypothetical protein